MRRFVKPEDAPEALSDCVVTPVTPIFEILEKQEPRVAKFN